MQTCIGKSKIQMVLEINEKLHNLKQTVREFVTYYDTDNEIFGLNEKMEPEKISTGFLSIESTFENLESALDSINGTDMAIQILNRENNGRVYRVGHIKPLSECDSSKNVVVNLKTLQEV